jgi:hypothetical protein
VIKGIRLHANSYAKYEPNIAMNDKTTIRMPSCGEETNSREGKNQIRLNRSN